MKDINEMYTDLEIIKEQYTDITERILSDSALKEFRFNLENTFYSTSDSENIRIETTFSGKIYSTNFKTKLFVYNSSIDNFENFKSTIRAWLYDTLDFLVNVF